MSFFEITILACVGILAAFGWIMLIRASLRGGG
jgi:hypothetical protein